ncbi:MAG TPA: hypothetical protein VI758_02315 [Bacteroidota bacterium]
MLDDRSSNIFDRYNPAVTNPWLIGLAGTTWGLVGLLLCRYSYGWLAPLQPEHAAYFVLAGIAIAVVVYRFGMSRIAQKNLQRLQSITGKRCVFGFLTWKSYVNIAVMVTMGVTLRHSAVPKDYLSLVYTSMGGSLLMGSVHYFRTFFPFQS